MAPTLICDAHAQYRLARPSSDDSQYYPCWHAAMLGFSIVKVFIWAFWREGGMLFAAAVILCAVSVSGESKRSVSDLSTDSVWSQPLHIEQVDFVNCVSSEYYSQLVRCTSRTFKSWKATGFAYQCMCTHWRFIAFRVMTILLTINEIWILWGENRGKWKRSAAAGSRTQDTSGLSRQCSATEPRQPDNHQPSQSSICTCTGGTECLSRTLASHSVLGVDWKILSIRSWWRESAPGVLSLPMSATLERWGSHFTRAKTCNTSRNYFNN